MGLAQLLSVGRSLKGAKDEPNKYKLLSQGTLPKFAPSKRPISLAPAVTIKKTVRRVETGSLFEAFRATKESAPRRPVTKINPQAPLVESKPPGVAAPVPSRVPGPVPVLAPVGGGMFFKKEKVRWWQRFFFWRSKSTVFNPVQTEMNLEKVRVMRNDLSDADLDVVAVARAARKSLKQPVAEKVAPSKVLSGEAWSRLTAKALHISKW